MSTTFQKIKKDTLSKINNKANLQDYLKNQKIAALNTEDVSLRMTKPKLNTGIVMDTAHILPVK